MTQEIVEPRAMTFAEWAAMDEDEPGELADGRIVEEEMPDAVHEVLVAWLVRVVGTWAASRGGFVLGSEAKFAVSSRRGRKPDLSVYLGGRRPPRRGVIAVPPDIVVEVVSRSPRDERRDRVEKVGEYAAFGVRLYVLVDPELRACQVLERGDDGRYAHAIDATGGTIDAVPSCEGLAIDLDAMWAEMERLGPEEGA